MNFDIFGIALIIGAIFVAAITSGRIAFFLTNRWGFRSAEAIFFFTAFGVVCAAVVMGFIATAAVHAGGNLFGLICVVGSMPFVGAAWGFIVGGIKAIERILFALLARLK